MVKETKTDTRNASDWDHFGVKASNKWKCAEKYIFLVFV